MDCRVVITEPAIADLIEIVRYIAQDNPVAAERTGMALIGRTKMLSQFPELGRRMPEPDLRRLREIVARPYRIIYRFKPEQSLVEILRFWHGARSTPVVYAPDAE